MVEIAFIDTEINPSNGKILDIGCVKKSGETFHKNSLPALKEFLKGCNYVCGHNILKHDCKFIGKTLEEATISSDFWIDTLYLSPLLFPSKPYHALVKDDKLQTDELNNPLNDAQKAKHLFYDELNAYKNLPVELQSVFYLLLNQKREFKAFFKGVKPTENNNNINDALFKIFENEICIAAPIPKFIAENPIELAYALALIFTFIKDKKIHSITPPWVLKNYPHVESILLQLRNKPCLHGCQYCSKKLDAKQGLLQYFGYTNYRLFNGDNLQEKAVNAAINSKSILAIFPTGGGKSITFQVPALLSGDACNGLSIIISPLQSLMKDQVDNLEKIGITKAVTINGLLDPIEKAKSFERVENGSANILYLSPESLRSKTIEKLILGRKIIRFIIDEAHCFSSWGQDFRVDYLYIADFIKLVQTKKCLSEPIPVSCFTATAKQKVIEDIQDYFSTRLNLNLELYTTKSSRKNLHYQVFQKEDEEDKYRMLRDLIEDRNCPSIIYVSRTKKATQLAQRLVNDGYEARAYHGKMDVNQKTQNQNLFLSGEIPIMVATSAFGMGVDKKDVGMVIHYEISDSLENYVQEAGRAGRDENITAECFVLYNEEDLSKHFILLNQTKLSLKEIQQIWKAIKDSTRFRNSISKSALEIARDAGWDEQVNEIETRVTTAIAALEEAGYLKRGQNMPRVFANSILVKNAQEAIDKIEASDKFNDKEKINAVRIIKKLLSSKNKKNKSEEAAESRIDYISDHLGIVKKDIIDIITNLKEIGVLADTKDLNAFIKNGDQLNKSLQILEHYSKIEYFLCSYISQEEETIHLKQLNEEAEKQGLKFVSIQKLKTILNFWEIKNWVKQKTQYQHKSHIAIQSILEQEEFKAKIQNRRTICAFICSYLYSKIDTPEKNELSSKDETLVEFSVHELKEEFEKQNSLLNLKTSVADIEDSLFYLSRIQAIKIEGGFLVVYNRLQIERLELNNKILYKTEDYQKLNQFYENKIQQIHIVGEYALKMINNYQDALQFVEDYFQLNYASFLNKYFKGSRQNEIKKNITPAKFKQLFGELSPAQLKIIHEKDVKNLVVAAGPGSGKTRILVHKLASLLLMEDVKHEQLLMLTFSRAAATEFKKRLIALIGNAANYVEIKTFHAYCFDLLGKIGTLEKSDDILKKTIEKINSKEVEKSKITKAVIVIDEAQDINEDEYHLVKTLMDNNEELRVIAVGDDDQNIYEFRGSNSKYLLQLLQENSSGKIELLENFRSKKNIVQLSNKLSSQIQNRLKSSEIIAMQQVSGELKLVQHSGKNLMVPLINQLVECNLIGSTCVLTKTNEEALQIAGIIQKKGLAVKLIQSNDGFNLIHLREISFFYHTVVSTNESYTISDECWDETKRKTIQQFKESNKLFILQNLLAAFEKIHPKIKYKSDLSLFISESKLEDFYSNQTDIIHVSTIHKAKGKEYDNVFLLLQKFTTHTDTDKRLLYVAISRAKNNLYIHFNNPSTIFTKGDDINLIHDTTIYPEINEIYLQLNHKDVWLSYFENCQAQINLVQSGDKLLYKDGICCNRKNEPILRFSKQFLDKLELLFKQNYSIKTITVNFMIYWHNDQSAKEILIVLPIIQLTKIQN